MLKIIFLKKYYFNIFSNKKTLKSNIYLTYKYALENGILVIDISNIENLKDHHLVFVPFPALEYFLFNQYFLVMYIFFLV